MEPFSFMLTGGHPNSLGRTVEVVDTVLSDPERLTELMDCYKSDDEVVRLRTSSAIKRVFKDKPEWFDDWADHLLDEVSNLDQPSAMWTQAQIFLAHGARMSDEQMNKARNILVRNLHQSDDWIVLNMTMKTLEEWTKGDPPLAERVVERIEELTNDERRSVAKCAQKTLKQMGRPLL